MDARCRQRLKAECGVERVRLRIGRVEVDLTHDAVVPGFRRRPNQLVIEPARQTAAAGGRRDHDAIDIDEAIIAGAKPSIVRTVIDSVLVQRDQQRIRDSTTRPAV